MNQQPVPVPRPGTELTISSLQPWALLDPDAADRPAAVSRSLKRTLWLGGGLVAVLLLMAFAIPVGGAVLATGQIGIESRVKRIAHPTGGVIGSILVTNGEHVNAGQLLMRLDDKVTGADASFSSMTVEQLLAQRARLEAERLGAGSIAFPPELLGAKSETAKRAMEDETRLFRQRAAEESQLRAQLAARVNQYREEISGLRSQMASLRTQRALIEPERAAVRDLWERKLVTINRKNQMERSAVDLEGNAGALEAQIAQAGARITEVQEQAIQLGQTRRVQAATDLATVNTALNQQRMRSVAATDQQDRSEIRAPYSGTVEKIAFAAIGDVVKPAEPIMEIVPDRDAKVVEVAVSPVDIDRVHAGQKAIVRFSSINRAATPEVPGKVTYVAADRSEAPEGRASFFVARIELDQAAVAREKLDLKSGLPAEVQITTGSRSLISYILKPLRDQFARAFRDN